MAPLKPLVRRLVPPPLVELFRRYKRRRQHQHDRARSAEEVFTNIYESRTWGGTSGEYCSGGGSIDDGVVSQYIDMVARLADSEGFSGLRFVDLGCGDFRVGRRLLALCTSYVGVDIVRPVVEANQAEYGSSLARFIHLDIIADDLPDGDVCFLRQVLQHLSNVEIAAILRKLTRYRWIFITEHHPTNNPRIVPNKDMVHGGAIRFYENSGVYPSAPPFDLPESALRVVLEVPGAGVVQGGDRGVIRTYLYEPGKASSA